MRVGGKYSQLAGIFQAPASISKKRKKKKYSLRRLLAGAHINQLTFFLYPSILAGNPLQESSKSTLSQD